MALTIYKINITIVQILICVMFSYSFFNVRENIKTAKTLSLFMVIASIATIGTVWA